MSTWMIVGRRKIEVAQVTSFPVRLPPHDDVGLRLTSLLLVFGTALLFRRRLDTFQPRHELVDGSTPFYGLVSGHQAVCHQALLIAIVTSKAGIVRFDKPFLT